MATRRAADASPPERLVASQVELYIRKSEVDMKRTEQECHYRMVRFGQVSALVVSLCFLASATFLVYNGHAVAGTILGTVDLVALATVFLAVGKQREVVEPAPTLPPVPVGDTA